MDNNIEFNINDINNNVKKDVRKTNTSVNKKKNNNNFGVVLIVTILLSFVCGALGAYLITSNVSVKQVVKILPFATSKV